MSEYTSYGAQRKKRKPRERPFFRERDPLKESSSLRSESTYSDAKDRTPGGVTSPLMKPPVILAKPDSAQRNQLHSASPVEEIAPVERSFRHERSMAHSNEGKQYYNRGSNLRSYPIKNTHACKAGSSITNQDHAPRTSGKESVSEHRPVKIVDNYLRWTDSGSDLLEENQTHFLVVGILGEQGVGKSALMSYLAGSEFVAKETIFPCQNRDNMERASNKTVGIDMYVTEERTIFLDTQPVLSPSLLEQCIFSDRKLSGDYNGPAAGIEMQSLQIVSFLFSVCHVVIIMQDWFGDTKLFNFIQCAEMLRMTQASSESSHIDNDFEDFYPHLVFVYNKAEKDLFDPMSIKAISRNISSIFAHSKLINKGSISLQKSSLFPELALSLSHGEEVNLFLIPTIDGSNDERSNCGEAANESYFQTLPNYGELPTSHDIMRALRKMILSIRSIPLTRKQLTEKSWYYYAAKMWEAIKKSQMMAEFNRLLM